jgi:predicted lipid-binding transport protein (Tim44 family)
MTPRQQTNQPNAQNQGSRAGQPAATARQQNRGMFGGMMGGLLGGLMLGGLIGLLLGGGLGGFAGFLGLIFQVGLIVLAIWLVMRLFRGRQQPAFAGGPQPGDDTSRNPFQGTAVPGAGSRPVDAAAASGPSTAPAQGGDEIGLTADDFDTFEQLLHEVQAAFTREDYAGLRERCTPEIVSFLSEELSQNAVNGVRNEVLDVKLLQGDLSEAWREGDHEYATVAMRYESIDVMRDRQSGEVVEGATHPTETTEVWTFVRPIGGRWQLSAIQES